MLPVLVQAVSSGQYRCVIPRIVQPLNSLQVLELQCQCWKSVQVLREVLSSKCDCLLCALMPAHWLRYRNLNQPLLHQAQLQPSCLLNTVPEQIALQDLPVQSEDMRSVHSINLQEIHQGF